MAHHIIGNQDCGATVTETSTNQPESAASPALGTPSQVWQALCHQLLDQLPIGIFQKDREGRYIFVNSWICRLHGTKREDYLGRTAREVAAARQAPGDAVRTSGQGLVSFLNAGADHHERILQTGVPVETEERYPDVEGKERFVHTIKGPLYGLDGTIIGSQGVLLDITEHKRVELQLANERDLLRALMDSATDAIYFKDRQSRFLRCSASMAPLFNLSSPDKLIGKSDADFQGEEHARSAFEDEQAIIRTGQPVIGKTEKETWPDGRVTWALTSKMPFYNDCGEIIGTLGISKNITAIKETESKVEQLHRQLLQTSREAGMAEVATSVLHNVGNVLNSVNVSAMLLLDNAKQSKVPSLGKAVKLLDEHAGDVGNFLTNDARGRQLPGYLKMLSEQLSKEQQQAVAELESVRENIDHVKEIVAMQQNYAKVFGVAETVKVTDIVEDALRMNTEALARHEVTLVRDYADESVLSIEKHKVLQVLVNLIRNAKYACDDSGRKDKQITVATTKHEQWVRITVSDNGVGIPLENITRIFNHGFTTRKDGHGFGLHSGALAAKELGGSLTAFSEGSGHGAVFTLEVPLQPPSVNKSKSGKTGPLPALPPAPRNVPLTLVPGGDGRH